MRIFKTKTHPNLPFGKVRMGYLSGEARWGLMTIYRVTSLFPRHINYTIEEGVPLRHALFTLILLLVYGIDPKRLFGLISQTFVRTYLPDVCLSLSQNVCLGLFPETLVWAYYFLPFGVAFIVIPFFLAVAFLVAVFSSTFTSAFGFSMSTSSTVKMRAS